MRHVPLLSYRRSGRNRGALAQATTRSQQVCAIRALLLEIATCQVVSRPAEIDLPLELREALDAWLEARIT